MSVAEQKIEVLAEPSEVSHEGTSESSADLRTYILVACVAAASLGLELIQTRILSFLYYNHVVYLTVTIALLGFGISGVLTSLFAQKSAHPERLISILTAAFALSSIICMAVVSHIPALLPNAPTTLKLVVSYLALTMPFVFSGAVLGWVFMIRAKSIGRLYAIDLACSSGAVVAFLLLLWPLGGGRFVELCGGIALLGFLVFSHKLMHSGWRFGAVAIYLLLLVSLNKNLIGNHPEPYKTLARANSPTATVETTQWTPISRIDVWSDSQRDLVFGTPSPDPADVKMITQDADAFTLLLGPHHVAGILQEGNRKEWATALSLTYLLNPNPNDALVIGVGGGIDMVTARAYGAKRITGVEINQATVALDRGAYSGFLQWPNWNDVNLVRAEGRNYLRSKPGGYDTVVMSGVDTFSALSSGAYLLSENYLYTVDAVQDYLRALKPNGTMAIYRWFFFRGPRESLRLASLLQTACEKMGIPHPEQHIMVVSEDLGWSGYRWAATFIKKEAFTPAEAQKVTSAVADNPRLSVVYLPKVFPPAIQTDMEHAIVERDSGIRYAQSVYNQLLTSSLSERQSFIQSYRFRIQPVSDDRPFFFEYYKPGTYSENAFATGIKNVRGPVGYYVLYILLFVCGGMCVTCILLPLWFFQRRGLEVAGVFPLLLFFACLGCGYMTFEVGAMQVLNVYVGDPAYSLALVLAGLLVASGIGAAISVRLTRLSALRVISLATCAIPVVIMAWLAFARVVHPLTMQLALGARAAIVLVGLLPVGILLGMPFPTAVRDLEKLYPRFIAWAWGVNGLTSVLASIVAIVAAMRMGFTFVVCISAATYLLAMISYRWHSRLVTSR
jgi:spermidine synthase